MLIDCSRLCYDSIKYAICLSDHSIKLLFFYIVHFNILPSMNTFSRCGFKLDTRVKHESSTSTNFITTGFYYNLKL